MPLQEPRGRRSKALLEGRPILREKGVIVDTALIKVAQSSLKTMARLHCTKELGGKALTFKACTILCLTIGPQSGMYLMKLGAYQQHKAG